MKTAEPTTNPTYDAETLYQNLVGRLAKLPSEYNQAVNRYVHSKTGHPALAVFHNNGATEEEKVAIYKPCILAVLNRKLETIAVEMPANVISIDAVTTTTATSPEPEPEPIAPAPPAPKPTPAPTPAPTPKPIQSKPAEPVQVHVAQPPSLQDAVKVIMDTLAKQQTPAAVFDPEQLRAAVEAEVKKAWDGLLKDAQAVIRQECIKAKHELMEAVERAQRAFRKELAESIEGE